MAGELNKQVKSRDRVRQRGEVFTAEREVNAMLDLVKEETERIESRFLEPACGTGNFLAEVLKRKLIACKKYEKSSVDWEKNSFFAVSSIYGIDIMGDNVSQCRERLYDIWKESASRLGRETLRVDSAVRYLLERNILHGNALSLKMVDENGDDTEDPITFSEWSWGGLPNKIQRRDFRLDILLEKSEDKAGSKFGSQGRFRADVQGTFDFLGETLTADSSWMPDPDDASGLRMIPAPTKVWPLVDYWRIHEEHSA